MRGARQRRPWLADDRRGKRGHGYRRDAYTATTIRARTNLTPAMLRRRNAARGGVTTIERMTVQRMDHVGIVVDDLAAAIEFFVELGLVLRARRPSKAAWSTASSGSKACGRNCDAGTPDGTSRVELSKFHRRRARAATRRRRRTRRASVTSRSRSTTSTPSLARLQAHGAELVGELEQYEDSYRLCYVRGPEGVIVELAQKIG